jgi:hypothetical protein
VLLLEGNFFLTREARSRIDLAIFVEADIIGDLDVERVQRRSARRPDFDVRMARSYERNTRWFRRPAVAAHWDEYSDLYDIHMVCRDDEFIITDLREPGAGTWEPCKS